MLTITVVSMKLTMARKRGNVQFKILMEAIESKLSVASGGLASDFQLPGLFENP